MDKVLILLVDVEGTITLASPGSVDILGHVPAELVGRPLYQLLAKAEDGERLRRALQHIADGETPGSDEAEWIARDGSLRRIGWQYTPCRDAEGRLRQVVVAAQDIAKTRGVIAELGEAMDRYQGILDTAVDGIITINQRGLIETFNRAAERIFGYRAAEVIGHNVSMLMPPPHRDQHDQYIDDYLRTRRKKIIGIGREVEGLRKDGTVFPLELAVGEVSTPAGRIFTGIIRDITDRREAEAEARRRLKEFAHLMRMRSMGELASGLAHEVNQPLTAIISNAQACLRMINANRADPELIRDALQQIARQGERAGEVIRRLRKYVEKGELEKVPSDLNVSVVEVLELLKHELETHHVEVKLEVEPDLPSVPADRVQIEQVMINLIRNAVDAMAASDANPARLYIGTRRGSHSGVAGIQISVRDTGPGISTEASGKLFEPFFSTKPDGLGQGLTICRRIIEAHGGRIWAEPVQPHGAAFHFWLPISAAP
jgi:two-component system sensor kinase FixL